MFERVKRFFRRVAEERRLDAEVDQPSPQRANPNPGRDDWYARVEDRSLKAAARRDTHALDAADASAPSLAPDAAQAVDELFARTLKR